MSLNKPYPHIYRHGSSSITTPYYEAWKSDIGIDSFASYDILKKDLRLIFEFIEPCKENFRTFSYRTFELLVRACTEVESLCKLVFLKNRVKLSRRAANIIRYSDLEGPMKLSEYEVLCYGFNYPSFRPFISFSNTTRKNRGPSWYQAYNSVKHNRSANFDKASLENVIQAVAAVYVLLVAQFGLGFDHKMRYSFQGHLQDVPDFFRARELPKWSNNECYDFNWDNLKNLSNPFDFHSIPIIT